MPTSQDYNYQITRNNLVYRAMRIVGAIGQGETPNSTAITEAQFALNDICKAWEAEGMPLWAISTYTLTPIQSQATYIIPGTQIDLLHAPLKIIRAYDNNSSTDADSELLIITRQQYEILGDKTSEGSPNQVWYNPPEMNGVMVGHVTLYPTPGSDYITYNTIKLVGQRPFALFNSATDVPDFPPYFYNALTWGLADQLAYEYGVAYAGRSMITKKAAEHKKEAFDYDQEEGSFYIQPQANWDNE